MIITESPIVENFQRNLTFPNLCWLDKEEYVKNAATGIQPFVECSNEKLFIAKNLAYLTNTTKSVFVGYVAESENKLKIATSGDKKVKIEEDFYVLTLQDPDSYFWSPTTADLIPKYALRACLNYNLFEYSYIGRTDSHLIGNVCRSDGLLYVCNELNQAKSFDKYEILCLKPSPASLKQLCRIALRTFMDHSNAKITTSLQQILPNSLVEYIKYPAYLSNGDCLLKNEKLVSDNGLHELQLTQNSKLVYETVASRNKRILYDYVESIWVNRYFTVINRHDNAFVYFLYLLNSYDSASVEAPRLLVTDNGQLVLQQGDVTFKKYFIQEECT